MAELKLTFINHFEKQVRKPKYVSNLNRIVVSHRPMAAGIFKPAVFTEGEPLRALSPKAAFGLKGVMNLHKSPAPGQIVNALSRNKGEIRSETALRHFGLLVTMEDETSTPFGPAIGIVEMAR